MIIDFLHTDKPSLRACSLVCHSWAAAAQYHIIYSCRLTAEPKKGGYAVQLRPLLQPPFGGGIRELVLTPGPSRYSPISELTVEILLTALTSLTRLRSLKLSETGFVETGDIRRPTSASRFRLKKLTISWMYPTSPGTSHGFQDVLSLFDEIRELNLGSIHAKHLPASEADFEDSAVSETKVQNLVLTDVSPPLVATLSRLVCADHLRTVKACINAAHDVSQLGVLLHNVGAELEQFQLAIWNFWFSDIIGAFVLAHSRPKCEASPLTSPGAKPNLDWSALNLSSCTRLRSVVILYANSGVFYSWQTVLDILDIVPATIRELTIVVRESDCFNTLNWRQMEGRLSKFTELTRLSFRLCKGGDSFRSREVTADIMQDIYGALPAFKARNALFL